MDGQPEKGADTSRSISAQTWRWIIYMSLPKLLMHQGHGANVFGVSSHMAVLP